MNYAQDLPEIEMSEAELENVSGGIWTDDGTPFGDQPDPWGSQGDQPDDSSPSPDWNGPSVDSGDDVG